jgi:hypothetical protein
VLTSLISGAMSGILGSVLGKAMEFLKMRQQAKEATEDRKHELALLEMTRKQAADQGERELEAAEASAATEIKAASYAHDVAGGESQWVTNVLRLFRPAITLFLVGVGSIFFFFVSDEMLIKDLPIKAVIVESVLYAASAAVFWWFGDRGPSPKRR